MIEQQGGGNLGRKKLKREVNICSRIGAPTTGAGRALGLVGVNGQLLLAETLAPVWGNCREPSPRSSLSLILPWFVRSSDKISLRE